MAQFVSLVINRLLSQITFLSERKYSFTHDLKNKGDKMLILVYLCINYTSIRYLKNIREKKPLISTIFEFCL